MGKEPVELDRREVARMAESLEGVLLPGESRKVAAARLSVPEKTLQAALGKPVRMRCLPETLEAVARACGGSVEDLRAGRLVRPPPEGRAPTAFMMTRDGKRALPTPKLGAGGSLPEDRRARLIREGKCGACGMPRLGEGASKTQCGDCNRQRAGGPAVT